MDPMATVSGIASGLGLPPEVRVEILQALEAGTRTTALLELLRHERHRTRLLELIPSLSNFSLSLRDAEDRAP